MNQLAVNFNLERAGAARVKCAMFRFERCHVVAETFNKGVSAGFVSSALAILDLNLDWCGHDKIFRYFVTSTSFLRNSSRCVVSIKTVGQL